MLEALNTPLIGPDNVFALCAILVGLAWLGFWIDGTWLGRRSSGVVWVLIAGMALSNFGALPFSTPAYDVIGKYFVPLSIPLLLFKANLRRIFVDGGPVLAAFALAAFGTVVGAITGYLVFDLGEIGPKAAGVYTGGWIGGAVNFVGVARAVELTPEEFTIAIGASSGVSIIMLMTLVALSGVPALRRLVPSAIIDAGAGRSDGAAAEEERIHLRLPHVSGALALSFLICAVSAATAASLGLSNYEILFITAFAVTAANIAPRFFQLLEGDFQLGMFAMYLFFASIGLGTDAISFLSSAPVLFLFGLWILGVHLIVVVAGARLFRIDLAQAIIGSGAALVGPAPTAAIASARGWRGLVTPGIMCGVLGYAIATFIGV
ncbi:MAG: DUF819 family protein, partial [Pseudomonadota bacterium]